MTLEFDARFIPQSTVELCGRSLVLDVPFLPSHFASLVEWPVGPRVPLSLPLLILLVEKRAYEKSEVHTIVL